MLNIPKNPDKENMIYLFLSEDHKIMLPFKGSESEMLQLWDVLAQKTILTRLFYKIIFDICYIFMI